MEARTHEPQRRLKYIQPFPFDQSEIIGVIKYKIGQKRLEKVHYANGYDRTLWPGKVVYVHPCGRFYTVEFEFKGKKIRECYTVRTDMYDYLIGGEKDAEPIEPVSVNRSRERKHTARFR